VAAAVQREWTLNLGQRSAYERLAHLLIELYLRLEAVGRAHDGRCDFPLTQNDLADATGLTAVHVNRTLQELRHDGLIELDRKQLQILDLERMVDVSMFNPRYLHLDHEGRHLDAND
jgi:CRP-like cAMP-binding protein